MKVPVKALSWDCRRGVRVFAGALVVSTKSKRKQKRSDIEAKDGNETKTFWCVPEPKVKRFYLFQKFQNKTKIFDVFQLFFSKSKTLLFNPKIYKLNQNVLI